MGKGRLVFWVCNAAAGIADPEDQTAAEGSYVI